MSSINEYVLGIDDTEQKQKLFRTLVDQVIDSNLLPELERGVNDQHYLDALLEYATCMNTYVAESTTGLAICMMYEDNKNPHILGSGLVLALTLAVGDKQCLRQLMRSIKRFARCLNKDWLAVHHHVAKYEYRCRYYELR